MKKTLCLLMVLSAFASVANAQSSVTVYGLLDAGITTQSHAGNPSAGRATALTDAPILPSVYGFKGREDLGGGLTVGFNLEGGLNSVNGQHDSPAVYQTQLFGREAKMTLSGDWGIFGVGLQVDPGIIAAVATEPRGMTDSFSHLEYWIMTTLGNNLAGGGSLQGGIFDQSALTYTYIKNGLYVGVEYGVGGVAGSTSANSTESIGVSYSNGGFTVSGSYVRANNVDPSVGGESSVIDVFGAGYDFGSIAVRGQYGEFQSGYVAGTATNDVKSWGIGLDWKISAPNKINLSYYDAKDHGAAFGGKTTEIALLDIYSLSKHTQVYGQIVDVKADANAGLSNAIGGIYTTSAGGLGATLGSSTLYFGVGVQHAF